MTKLEMAMVIVKSPAWDGCGATDLVKNYSKDEIQDIYDYLDTAEEEYFNAYYTEEY